MQISQKINTRENKQLIELMQLKCQISHIILPIDAYWQDNITINKNIDDHANQVNLSKKLTPQTLKI